jgi:hypothetical protein
MGIYACTIFPEPLSSQQPNFEKCLIPDALRYLSDKDADESKLQLLYKRNHLHSWITAFKIKIGVAPPPSQFKLKVAIGGRLFQKESKKNLSRFSRPIVAFVSEFKAPQRKDRHQAEKKRD